MSEKNITIGFIGAGNMAHCLIGGLVANGFNPDKLWASNPSEEKLTHLQQQFNIHTSRENAVVAEQADLLIFSVKPAVMPQVVTELAPLLQQRRPLILSIAAGIRIEKLQQWLGNDLAIVR